MVKKKQSKLTVPQNQRKVKGHGDFTDATPKNPVQTISRIESKVDKLLDSKKSSGSAGSMLGRGLGTLVGNGDLGAAAGDAISKWFGYGDYDIKTNSLIKAVSEGSMIPTFSKDGRRGTRIVEREFLGDVVTGTSGAFTNTQYRLNPADPRTFPWLSSIAAQYEEWEPNGIIFEFKSTSGTFNGTNQNLGTVIMMTDYDPNDPAPLNKLQMENADYSCSSATSVTQQHGVECDPSERPGRVLYVSPTSLTGPDAKFHDLGNFNLATVGVSGSSIIVGELWVSYDITFYKKQLIAGQFGNTTYFAMLFPGTAADLAASTESLTLGPAPVVYGNMRMTWDASTRTLSFPSNITTGRYQITYWSHGTTAIQLGISPTVVNCTTINEATTQPLMPSSIPLYTPSMTRTVADSTGAFFLSSRFIQITGSPASLTYSASGLPTAAGVDETVMYVQQIPLSSYQLL